MSADLRRKLELLTQHDIEMLIEKGETYGDSWKRRGGTGAFMMLARKWDRIEKASREHDYDVFAAIEAVDYLIDDVVDLVGYLLLVRAEGLVLENAVDDETDHIDGVGPLPRGYVNQDNDVHSEMSHRYAAEAAKSRASLVRMGDTELLEFCQVKFATPRDIESSIVAEKFGKYRRELLMNLQLFHNCMMTGDSPPRDLRDILDASPIVVSFVNPYSRLPGLRHVK